MNERAMDFTGTPVDFRAETVQETAVMFPPALDTAFVCDCPFASAHPSPNHNERPRAISSIILHYTGMPTAQSALDLLCNPVAEVSAHYFIDEDGAVLQLVPERRRAWHAGRSFWGGESDVNASSIGVEVVHPGHADPRPYAKRQIEATAALVSDICARQAIRPERVLAHSDVAVSRKIDPGEFFPWDELARAGVGHWVAPAPIHNGAAIALGDAGEAVAALQRDLAGYGYQIEATGEYSEQTACVVAAFQRHFRPARVDGRADESTRATLKNLLAALKERR